LRGLEDVELRQAGAGWTLAVRSWDGAVTASAGLGHWQVTEPGGGLAPVAVSAGWPAADRVVVDLILLESPHRLRLTGELASATLCAQWHTEPLSGVSLRSMQRPLQRAPDGLT
jgi:hypothetical protein